MDKILFEEINIKIPTTDKFIKKKNSLDKIFKSFKDLNDIRTIITVPNKTNVLKKIVKLLLIKRLLK